MSAISENIIKHITLGFLRSFYRARTRAENDLTISGTDMKGSNNIIADGFLRFTEADGHIFTATFEATSQLTRDEIVYRPRKSHVFWDAMAFAFLLVPLSLAIAHASEWYPLVGPDFNRRMLLLLASFPAWVMVYYILFARLPRYRYIYAIEQFKQYQADDQWIAFAYDVFAEKSEKYRTELLRQCTRYGFGVVEINYKRQPRLLMAPSRADHFVPKQKALPWLPRAEWRAQMANVARKPWQKLKARFQTWLGASTSRYFRWFPRTYYYQWSIVAAGLLVSFFLIKTEYDKLPIHFVAEAQYKAEQLASQERPEPGYYVIDAPVAPVDDSTYQPYVQQLNEEQFSGLLQMEEDEEAEAVGLPPLRILGAEPGMEMAAYYSCNRYNRLDRAYYYLYDTTFASLHLARMRLAELNDEGLSATAVWPQCLGIYREGFLVYVDELGTDSLDMAFLRDSFNYYHLDTLQRQLELRQLNPITN
ncbi:MAG: hypothetical protein AAGJ82_05200 [Bacteroidota bacterium]